MQKRLRSWQCQANETGKPLTLSYDYSIYSSDALSKNTARNRADHLRIQFANELERYLNVHLRYYLAFNGIWVSVRDFFGTGLNKNVVQVFTFNFRMPSWTLAIQS